MQCSRSSVIRSDCSLCRVRASDLGPVRARVERANAHVETLRKVIDEYLAAPPYGRKKRIVPDRLERVVERAELRLPVPIEASIVLSDAIHQARAALDNLVGVLRPGEPTRRSGFAIVAEEGDYEEAAGVLLDGVPTRAQDVIRWMQPFERGAYGWIGDELIILHRLARVDRHRAPHLQSALLLPQYVETDDGADVEFRGDGRTWAETEYNVPFATISASSATRHGAHARDASQGAARGATAGRPGLPGPRSGIRDGARRAARAG
jgi:hypothetical protein